MKMKRTAFTLVELLVVIGIIAVLIGILLPALNRARQQANLVSCSSRLRQMGEALSIYESENKGRMPLSEFGATDSTFKQSPSYLGQYQWYWVYTLGQELTRNNIIGTDGTIHALPPIFGDVDTIPKQSTFAAYPLTFACHYMCNPRVFLDPLVSFGGTRQNPIDILKGPLIYGRSASDIKHSADVFVIWDAPQEIDRGYNAYPVAQTIDAYAMYTNGLMYLTKYAGQIDSSLPIFPDKTNGVPGMGSGAMYQKLDNFDGDSDTGSATGVVCLRFRHMNNTKLAALCVDGHVETRLIGAVLRKDIYTNVMGTTNN